MNTNNNNKATFFACKILSGNRVHRQKYKNSCQSKKFETVLKLLTDVWIHQGAEVVRQGCKHKLLNYDCAYCFCTQVSNENKCAGCFKSTLNKLRRAITLPSCGFQMTVKSYFCKLSVGLCLSGIPLNEDIRTIIVGVWEWLWLLVALSDGLSITSRHQTHPTRDLGVFLACHRL